MGGYICLFRKFLDWEWHDSPNVVTVWMHLLCLANYEAKEWRGIVIERGQLVTSVKSLSELVRLSVMQVRTALVKLQSTKEITINSTNKYTIVTICKYDYYQSLAKENQQTNNKQITNKQQQHKNINNIYTKEDNKLSSMSNSSSQSPLTDINYEAFKNFWNDKMRDKEVRKITSLSEERRKTIHRRAVEHGKESLMTVVEKTSMSNFLNGDNKTHFIASFDWVMRPRNYVKVLEGNYDNR